MPLKTLSITVSADGAGRVDLVVKQMTDASRNQIRGMIDHGCVTINGIRCKNAATTTQVGDVVAVRFEPTQRYHPKKERWDDRTFTIVFEDDYLIVVNKTSGTLTVPTDRHEPNTLVDRVSVYLSHSRGNRQAWVVHRLDRDVSGLLVLGKSESTAQHLIEQFKQRKPQRVYAAIVAGAMVHDEGTFRSHLATAQNLDRYATKPSRATELAITHYRVRRRMPDSTQVDVTLETGRRNQIRVHFADAGHPVLGDTRYGANRSGHARWNHKRLALHAQTLGFEHPQTGENLTFQSPLPFVMEKFLRGAGK